MCVCCVQELPGIALTSPTCGWLLRWQLYCVCCLCLLTGSSAARFILQSMTRYSYFTLQHIIDLQHTVTHTYIYLQNYSKLHYYYIFHALAFSGYLVIDTVCMHIKFRLRSIQVAAIFWILMFLCTGIIISLYTVHVCCKFAGLQMHVSFHAVISREIHNATIIITVCSLISFITTCLFN